MLVALSVRFIISHLSVIITRGRTSTLELKLVTITNIHSHFLLASVIYHFQLPQCCSITWKTVGIWCLAFILAVSHQYPSYRWCRLRPGRFVSCFNRGLLWRRMGQFFCLPLAKQHLLKALGGRERRSLWCPAKLHCRVLVAEPVLSIWMSSGFLSNCPKYHHDINMCFWVWTGNQAAWLQDEFGFKAEQFGLEWVTQV